MDTAEQSPAASGTQISADEFQALEQKVLRAVEVVRREREARAAAEADAASLREQLATLTAASNEAQTQITTLNQERESVKSRVEKCCSRWMSWSKPDSVTARGGHARKGVRCAMRMNR